MDVTQHATMTTRNVDGIKRAELLSSLGAGVLGAGLALLWPNILASYAIPILLLGIAAHTIGMFQKHSLEEQANSPRARWMQVLYWFCWLALGALLVYILVRVIW